MHFSSINNQVDMNLNDLWDVGFTLKMAPNNFIKSANTVAS